MTAAEIDDYLAAVPEPARGTLENLRATILEIVPDAEQGISYAIPAFRVDGTVVAGFAAFTNHLTYVPHSGSVLGFLAEDLAGYSHSKSALRFAFDTPLPPALVKKLIETRISQIG